MILRGVSLRASPQCCVSRQLADESGACVDEFVNHLDLSFQRDAHLCMQVIVVLCDRSTVWSKNLFFLKVFFLELKLYVHTLSLFLPAFQFSFRKVNKAVHWRWASEPSLIHRSIQVNEGGGFWNDIHLYISKLSLHANFQTFSTVCSENRAITMTFDFAEIRSQVGKFI